MASKHPRPVLSSVVYCARPRDFVLWPLLTSLVGTALLQLRSLLAASLRHIVQRGDLQKGHWTFCGPQSVCSLVANESVAPQSTHLTSFIPKFPLSLSTFFMPVSLCPYVAFYRDLGPVNLVVPCFSSRRTFCTRAPRRRSGSTS